MKLYLIETTRTEQFGNFKRVLVEADNPVQALTRFRDRFDEDIARVSYVGQRVEHNTMNMYIKDAIETIVL